MLAPAISKVREFLGSWKNLLALGTLPLLGAWIYSRVWMVNPAILGDEYLYSMNARKVGPWDPPVAGDFSNYLFNFVYQGTNLCGDAFYACGKIFNIAFFLGFIFTIFILALRFLPFWGAYAFMIAAALSPLSVYTSMFLPESMYFFFIGIVLVAVLRAMTSFTWINWALVGISIGVTSLVKPHAWLSAIAIGVTLVVVGLGSPSIGLKGSAKSALSIVLGAVVARVTVGLLVAGPKALDFFGVYFGTSQVGEIAGGLSTQVGTQGEPSGPIAGVLDLFFPQLYNHLLAISALMGLAIVGLAVGVFDIFRERSLIASTAFSLFATIWLLTMVLEIVIFTGWITGNGDDHTSRLLLRYFDFLFVIVPLAALSVLAARKNSTLPAFLRWSIAIALSIAITPAFSGHFASLTIQIADAPTLAGLVVNLAVFNTVAILGFTGLFVFATFPKYFLPVLALFLPVSMAGTGYQIHDQYLVARGTLNSADIAGKYLAQNADSSDLNHVLILASSRFDATNAAIWVDRPQTTYELYNPGGIYESDRAPEGTRYIVTIGDLAVVGENTALVESGERFIIYKISD